MFSPWKAEGRASTGAVSGTGCSTTYQNCSDRKLNLQQIREVVGENAKAAVAAMKDGDVILLENTRYRAEETKNGDAFSKELASLCDVFVNDAFGTAHQCALFQCGCYKICGYSSCRIS